MGLFNTTQMTRRARRSVQQTMCPPVLREIRPSHQRFGVRDGLVPQVLMDGMGRGALRTNTHRSRWFIKNKKDRCMGGQRG